MKKETQRSLAALAALAVVTTLGACTADPESSGPTHVVLTVGGKPTPDREAQLAEWERLEAEFEAANPDITIEAEETGFNVSTFNALVAGGQLPTVFNVPFTEMRGLIERQQVADITDALSASSLVADIVPTVKELVTVDGRTYGMPYSAYTQGLVYNRALFEQAGLDPDSPPATWDEVREAAQAIEENTDAQGFMLMTTANNGGWMLTTMSYGFGGTIVSEDGLTAEFDNPATIDALEFLHTLRWTDNAMGNNFLLGYDDVRNEFAAGQVGMYVLGAGAYSYTVSVREMPADDFGAGPLPQQPDGIGTLGGGTVAIVKPTATEAEKAAAIRWIEFHRFSKFKDEATAKASAEAAAADGVPVGIPEFSVVAPETYEQYLGWIDEHINVPREHFTAYLDSVNTLPLVPEPAVKAQELYAILDSVVQAVLTREDADIPALLAEAEAQAQSALDAG